MTSWHHVLENQLNKFITEYKSIPTEWAEFIKAVNVTYKKFEKNQKDLETIQKIENQYLSLIQSLPVAMIVHSKKEIVLANAAAIKLMKISDIQDIINKPLHQFFHPQSKQNIENMIETCSESNNMVCKLEEKAVCFDGTEIDIELITNSVSFNDEAALQIVMRDITTQKQTTDKLQLEKETVKAASRAKSEFLANMSHEIRTPLNGIIGLNKSLLDLSLTSAQHQHVTLIQKSALQLQVLLNDILDYFKIEAGQLTLDYVEFDLEAVLENVCSMAIQNAGTKKIDLNVFLHKNVPTFLIGDAVRLSQVLLNLIGNAVKFTEKGQIFLKIDLLQQLEGMAQIRFSVYDTGIGVPKETQHNIFEGFTQADSSTTRKYGGTGIGLAISNQLVQMMSGKIWIESPIQYDMQHIAYGSENKISELFKQWTKNNKKGSGFHFTARFATQDSEEKVNTDNSELAQKLNVISISKNLAFQLVIEELLSPLDCSIQMYDDENKAVDQIKGNNSSTMVIIDHQSLDLDNHKFTKRIRRDNTNITIPVVVVTLNKKQEIVEGIQNLEQVYLLNKPMTRLQISNIISTAFKTQDLTADDTENKSETNSNNLIEQLSSYNQDIRILLTEDNIINQKVVQALLKKTGVQVDVAGNGQKAVDMLKEESYDLVLMDVQMPIMDGPTATRIIRDELGMKELPIIAITAHAMKGDKEECFIAGMNDYISKPIDNEEFYQVLVKWLIPAKFAMENP